MSSRKESVGHRIEEVRKRIPPPPQRKSPHTYISKDDLAELVGVSRSRIYAWTRPDTNEYPDLPAQERLAELSAGQYVAADFARPGRREAGSLERRLAAVEATVERLERHIFGKGASRAR